MIMRIAFSIAYVALQAASVLAQNSTCEPGPCVGPEVVAWESSECQQYHIFIARGSDSSYPGHQGPLVNLICQELDDCGYENIVYPANSSSTGPGNWCPSAHKGAVNGQQQLTDYAQRCPNSKLILTGFSQGASVVLDILGGGGGGPGFDCEWQEPNGPLDVTQLPGSNIAAALTFGAVVRSAGQNYTLERGMIVNGTSPRDFDGKVTRKKESLEVLKGYSDVLREYCHVGDQVCAKDSEPGDIKKHLNYFDLHNEDAAAWVISKVTGRAYIPKANTETKDPSTAHATVSKTKEPEKTTAPTSHPTPEAASTASPANGANILSQGLGWAFFTVFSALFSISML